MKIMKIITFIYIFFLYVLFTPGFFMKTKLNMETYLLYALLFSIIFFFTIKIVDGTKENYEKQITLNMTGMNNLAGLIKTQKKNNEMNIDIENQVKGSENSGAKCWNALGKTQKDIELLRLQLDSYGGNWETIQKLNETIIQHKDKIAVLKTQLGAYENAEQNIVQLITHLDQYKGQLEALQKQAAAFSGTETDLENLKTQYDNFLIESEKLTSNLVECNALTPGKITTITELNSTITNNNNTISSLQPKFNIAIQKIAKLDEIQNKNNVIIADIGDAQSFNKKEYCPKYRYILNETKETWSWHEKNAKKQGGVLTPVGSAEENTLVYNARKNYSGSDVWMGGYRYKDAWWSSPVRTSSVWTWVDNSKWNYTNWGSNEPNNRYQKGTVMWPNGQWDDNWQERKYPAVYKIPNY